MKIFVSDIVSSTYSNTDGFSLFLAIDNALKNNDVITISFRDITSLSSSFLNSSFGELYEKYDHAILKKRVLISDYTPSVLNMIKDYITRLQSFSIH